MLDIRLIRDHPEEVRKQLERRGIAHVLDDVLEADKNWRELIGQVEDMRRKQNEASKSIGRAGSPEERTELMERARSLKADIDALEPQVKEAEEQLEMLMAGMPNLPHESVPDGESDDDNVEISRWGEHREMPDARDHLDIGRQWGVIDTERAARASGSRFGYLMGEAVWLEFALVRYAFDVLDRHGFTPVIPPVLVRRDVMFGAGDLPSDEAQFYVVQDGLYLTGTSEQALVALHAEEDLQEDELPKRYSAFSSCFRREAGAWGRDTRGIFRVHQFDKVEMFSFTHPDASWDEFEFIVSVEEELFRSLEIPYRMTNVCAGELGAKAAKKIDLEAWFPGQGRYRELTSCSNCTDYQARRLSIRLKGREGRRVVHTLNGTAIAMGRTIAAIMENFQDAEGRVSIPDVLHPYLPQGLTTIPAGR